jgi:hypothetical protein
VGVGRFGEGSLPQWCGFNASVLAREGGDGIKHCQKMKWRQRARLGSMERKRDITQWHDIVDQRRDDTKEGKGRRRR